MTSIMVVEDERIVAKNIEESLLSMGYDVLGSHATGADCLRQAGERRPDLVLVDVRIKGDVDGIETAKLLRSRFDVPVVFLTAYADDETLRRAREAEPHGYILKPFRASDLRAGVEIAVFKHRLETQLKDRERWFSTTLRAIGDAVITVDSDEKVTFVNRVGEVLTGSKQEQLVGRPLTDVFRLFDERTGKPVAVPIREAFRGEKATRIPSGSVLSGPDGEVPIEDSVAPIVDESGKLWGAVIVFRDVSEQRRLEERVARSDRLASLGTLAAGIAHEINNPLTFILGNVSVVLRELSTLKESLLQVAQPRDSSAQPATRLGQIEEALIEVNEGAERIQQIISDLRIFARPESGRQSGDVIASIEWALRVVGSLVRERARVELDLKPIPPARGDGTRLGQVFLNLLINAAQAIPVGNAGRNVIRVSTELDAEDRIMVTIADSGTGMSSDVVKHIFDPFFTTKPIGSGTGLGLSICHGIVLGLGGEIAVESTPGKGTVFRVLLPRGEAAVESRPLEPTKPAAGQWGRILVVDDDAMLRRAMNRMLGSRHSVRLAANAREALDALMADSNFDVVLCDVMMPDVSGIELFERIGTHWPHLTPRVAFLTGAGFTPSVADFLASIENPRLTKPFNASALNEFVQTVLESGGKPSV